jgi:hypothetical protein
MTCTVRVEKADTTDFILKVQVQQKNSISGEWVDMEYTDTRFTLIHPASQMSMDIWEGRRLIIEEAGTNDMIYTNREAVYKWQERASRAEQILRENGLTS